MQTKEDPLPDERYPELQVHSKLTNVEFAGHGGVRSHF